MRSVLRTYAQRPIRKGRAQLPESPLSASRQRDRMAAESIPRLMAGLRRPADVLAIQRSLGNQAVLRLLARNEEPRDGKPSATSGGARLQRQTDTLRTVGAISLDLAGGDPDVAELIAPLVKNFWPPRIGELRRQFPEQFTSTRRIEILLHFTNVVKEKDFIEYALKEAGGDDDRLFDIAGLFVIFHPHLELTRKVFEDEGRDVAKATSKLRRLKMFNYNPALLDLAEKQAAELTQIEVASTTRVADEQLQQETQAADDELNRNTKEVSKHQLKRRNPSNKVREALASNQRAKEARDQRVKAAKEAREQTVQAAQAAAPQKAEQIVGEMGKFVKQASKSVEPDTAAWALKESTTTVSARAKTQETPGAPALNALDLAQQSVQTANAIQQMIAAQKDQKDVSLAKQVLATTDPRKVAEECTALLTAGADPKNAFSAAIFCVETGNEEVKSWITSEATRVSARELDDEIAFLKKHSTGVEAKNALLAIQTLGLGNTLYDLEFLLTEKPDLVQWLLGLKNSPGFGALVTYLSNRQPKLAQIKEVVDYNSANNNQPLETLAQLLSFHGPTKVKEGLEVTAGEPCLKFLENFLGWGGTKASTIQFIQLVRLDALLKSGTAGMFTVYQADRRYQGKEDERTGFIRYQFVDGTVAEIHAHWNVEKKKLVSMHVQDASGQNGVEINKWPYFQAVQEAIRDAFNTTPVNQPTTRPPGGTLTL